MPQIVYLDRLDDLGAKTVSSIGDQPGPIGGDGWVTISQIPTARLQSNHHYAFYVTGKVGNFVRNGATPAAGVVQLCLGDGAGTQHPSYLVEIGFNAVLGPTEALPFAFLVIFSASPAISDPLWGATWANTFPMQLLGRIYRRGDAAAYTGSFDVTSLVWMWADLDAIPSTDQFVTRQTGSTALGASYAHLAASPTVLPGASADMWVHFWAVHYEPGVGAVPAFQVGWSIDAAGSGFNATNGGGGELGLGHTGTFTLGVRHHLGGFFAEPKNGTNYFPAVRGRNLLGGSTWKRFDVLSIRLTELGNVWVSSSPLELALTDWIFNYPTSHDFFPLEIPAEGRTWAPWTFAQGMPSSSQPIDIWLDTNAGQLLWSSPTHLRMQQSEEQAPCYASAADGIGSGDPDVQYRLAFLERVAVLPSQKTVRDIYLVTFYPVKDPDNVPPDPSDVGPPVEIVPGAESLGTGSLLDPPLAPNVDQMTEVPETVRHHVRGATGYARSWTTFVAARRWFSLMWGPVTKAQRDSLFAFLRANRAFRITAPRESTAIAVVQTSKVSARQIDVTRFEVRVDIAELIYTEP